MKHTMKILIYDTHTEHVLLCKLHGVRPAFTGDILHIIIHTDPFFLPGNVCIYAAASHAQRGGRRRCWLIESSMLRVCCDAAIRRERVCVHVCVCTCTLAAAVLRLNIHSQNHVWHIPTQKHLKTLNIWDKITVWHVLCLSRATIIYEAKQCWNQLSKIFCKRCTKNSFHSHSRLLVFGRDR
jgi:hypothetical protein